MSKLRASDSNEVQALASLATVGRSSYVIKPKVINYAGAVNFDVSCPRLVSVTSKNDRVDSLVVDFATGDSSSLELSLALASYWRGKFAGMNLDQGPDDLRAYVVSIDVARKEFNLIHPS